MSNHRAAYDFFESVQHHLNGRLPGPIQLKAEISARWDKPKEEKSPQELLACKENIFIYHFVLPEIWKCTATVDGMNPSMARQSIRCEYHSKFPHISSANAYRVQGYPFPKNLGVSQKDIFAKWTKQSGGIPINQAYPDFALGHPFPFRTVFDGKLFEDGSYEDAKRALVAGVYEAAFYRGLPASSPLGTGWGYDFGCLLAYDASDGAHLQHAWNSIRHKQTFWSDANVYVMILRGAD